MSLPTCLVYSPGIDSGVELMGMPSQHLFILLLKLLRVGIITACSGSPFQTVSCVKNVNFLFILYNMFSHSCH